MKTKGMNDAQFLALLERVLPKATPDPRLASTIYDRVAEEVRLLNNLKSFEKFCAEGSLPDLEPATVQGFREQVSSNFSNAQVTVEPSDSGHAVAVEIVLPDRTVSSKLKVIPPSELPEEEEKVRFVPFPVALPEDPGLFWILARRENIPPDEAGILLSTVEQEFWETKGGQKAQKDRVEKSFAEFIQRVPAAALADRGLKRHYKDPEPSKILHRGPVKASRPSASGGE